MDEGGKERPILPWEGKWSKYGLKLYHLILGIVVIISCKYSLGFWPSFFVFNIFIVLKTDAIKYSENL